MNRCALFSLLLSMVLTAPSVRGDEVDDYVRVQMKNRHVPGLSLAVVRDGQVVKAMGYGMANVEHSAPATENTAYQLASVTKQFTAVATMMLVEEGKLSLDSKVTEILDGLPAAWSGVTVRHLLNHTSGIKSYTGLKDFFVTARKDYDKAELIKLVADLPMEFAPGDRFAYNNTGYYLLGMILEKVSGKDYDAFLRARIFEPLGMASTRLNNLTEIIPNRAQGYAWRNGTLKHGEYVSPTQPFSAGALITTVTDLAKWDAALYGDKLLKRSALEAMWAPTKLNDGKMQDYGFGWEVSPYRTKKRLSHGGGIQGFSTFVERFVDDKVTVIVLANSENARSESIAHGVAEFYVPGLKEAAPKPITDKQPQVTEFHRKVLLTLATGTADETWFTPEFQKFLFPDRVKEGKQMFGSGQLKSFDLMEEDRQGARTRRVYHANFEGAQLRVNMTFLDTGKIGGIGVSPQ